MGDYARGRDRGDYRRDPRSYSPGPEKEVRRTSGDVEPIFFSYDRVPITQPVLLTPAQEEILKTMAVCKRKGYVTSGQSSTAMVNFFKLKTPSTCIFQYHLDITFQGEDSASLPTITDVSRKTKRRIVSEVEKQITSRYEPVQFSFDGEHLLFSINSVLPLKEPQTFQVSIKHKATGPETVYYAKLTSTAYVDLSQMERFLSETDQKSPSIVSQVFDVVIGDIAARGEGMKVIKRNIFREQGARALGKFLELWSGFHMNVRPCQIGLLLNVDTAFAAFYKSSDSLINWASNVLSLRRDADLERLTARDIMVLNKQLKSIKIITKHRGFKKKFPVRGLSNLTAESHIFEYQGQKINVYQYFRDRYNIQLKYPRALLVEISEKKMTGGKDSTNVSLLPMEVCAVPNGQRYPRKLDGALTAEMVRSSSQKPADKIQLIKEEVDRLSKEKDINHFNIQFDKEPIRVDTRILPRPSIQYGNRQHVPDERTGAWNLRDIMFKESKIVFNWGVVLIDVHANRGEIDIAIHALSKECANHGVILHDYVDFQDNTHPPRSISETLQHSVNMVRRFHPVPQMILVILGEKSSTLYTEVKRTGDALIGVITQCLVWPTFSRKNIQYLGGVALKIFSKLNGISCDAGVFRFSNPATSSRAHSDRGPRRDIIMLGAFVNHAQRINQHRPSIAALVGSMDDDASVYCSRVRAQVSNPPSKTKSYCPVILNMDDMLGEILRTFYRYRKDKNSEFCKPNHIIIYRGGTADHDFDQVYRHEVQLIRSACKSIDSEYRPMLTYIMVQRRTHTKIFPLNESGCDRNKNAIPGTVIDRDIVSRWYYDFYLCSHSSIQANTTSRPSHYYVMLDESDMSPNDVAEMSYKLCYKYARCTRSVSMPTPVYYAHLVAQRARLYDERDQESDVESKHSGGLSDGSTDSFVSVNHRLEDQMFYV